MAINTKKNASISWDNIQDIKSYGYKCGYCNENISSHKGYSASKKLSDQHPWEDFGEIYICHDCGCPTFVNTRGVCYPGASYGNDVQFIPSQEVKYLYNEARNCMKVNAYTASVMCCRKLLMNIAVAEGAETNLKYIEYVDYLDTNNYIPPKGKKWVDKIRDKGNTANHEIKTMSKSDAEQLITFIEMLLKYNYEFPGMIEEEEKESIEEE